MGAVYVTNFSGALAFCLITLTKVREETNLTVSQLQQFRLYSDPTRDKRRHTASMVFRCEVNSIESLHQGDDAKQVRVVDLEQLVKSNFNSIALAFDHKIILRDFVKHFHPHIST